MERINPNVLRQYGGAGRAKEAGESGKSGAARQAGEGGESRGVRSDGATISSGARELQRVQAYVAELPDVRQDVVDALRSQIASGTYHVSAEAVVDGILRNT